MTVENIYSCSNHRDFLDLVSKRHLSRKQRPFSLRQWAHQLGYRSPRIVGMVLNGQRLPSQEMVQALARYLKLSDTERRYFELLVLLERRKRASKPLAPVFAELRQLIPAQKSHRLVLDLRAFAFVADWYHIAIKQVIGHSKTRDLNWIRNRLRRKPSLTEVKKAVENMLQLGLLIEGKKHFEVAQANVTTLNDVPSEAIRLHHTQMMERAKEALEEQRVDEREFTGATFVFDPTKISEAKLMLRKFRQEFEDRFSSNLSKGEVYQLNLQFFSHTISEGEHRHD